MSDFKCVPGGDLAYAAATFAVAIAQRYDNDDLAILSSFFCAVGDSLAIIAAQQAACARKKEANGNKQ